MFPINLLAVLVNGLLFKGDKPGTTVYVSSDGIVARPIKVRAKYLP